MIEIVVTELEKRNILEKYEKIILGDVNYSRVNLSEYEIIKQKDEIIENNKKIIEKQNNIIKEKQICIDEKNREIKSLVEEIIMLNNLCNEKYREIKTLTDKLNKLENKDIKSNDKEKDKILPVVKNFCCVYTDFEMVDYRTGKKLEGTFKDYYKSWEEYLKFLSENLIII